LVAKNLCLRQQLLVLQRRRPRPRLSDADRRFWILACHWFSGGRGSLLIVRAEWCWVGTARAGDHIGVGGRVGKQRPACDLGRAQIAHPPYDLGERLVGSAEDPSGACKTAARKVSARTVAKYMRPPHGRGPSGWRAFLKQHAGEIWACDFIGAQTILFRTLISSWCYAMPIAKSCMSSNGRVGGAADRRMLRLGRFPIHNRDSRYGELFDRRLQGLGIAQIRTPVRHHRPTRSPSDG
jgi:putative transposase